MRSEGEGHDGGLPSHCELESEATHSEPFGASLSTLDNGYFHDLKILGPQGLLTDLRPTVSRPESCFSTVRVVLPR